MATRASKSWLSPLFAQAKGGKGFQTAPRQPTPATFQSIVRTRIKSRSSLLGKEYRNRVMHNSPARAVLTLLGAFLHSLGIDRRRSLRGGHDLGRRGKIRGSVKPLQGRRLSARKVLFFDRVCRGDAILSAFAAHYWAGDLHSNAAARPDSIHRFCMVLRSGGGL